MKSKKKTNYFIRFGHSLRSANQLLVQEVIYQLFDQASVGNVTLFCIDSHCGFPCLLKKRISFVIFCRIGNLT